MAIIPVCSVSSTNVLGATSEHLYTELKTSIHSILADSPYTVSASGAHIYAFTQGDSHRIS